MKMKKLNLMTIGLCLLALNIMADDNVIPDEHAAVEITAEDATRGLVNQVEDIQASMVPVGGVIMWWGAVSDLPSNYEVCDGGIVTNTSSPLHGRTKPNFLDRFPMGSGDSNVDVSEMGSAGLGGKNVLWEAGNGRTDGHAITIEEMPKHDHRFRDPGHEHNITLGRGGRRFSGGGAANFDDRNWEGSPHKAVSAQTNIRFEAEGRNRPHTHKLPDEYRENRPAYQSLHFVIRVK